MKQISDILEHLDSLELLLECDIDISELDDIDEAVKARAPKMSPKDEKKKLIKSEIMNKINKDPSFIDISKKVYRLVLTLAAKYAPNGVNPKKINFDTIKILKK